MCLRLFVNSSPMPQGFGLALSRSWETANKIPIGVPGKGTRLRANYNVICMPAVCTWLVCVCVCVCDVLVCVCVLRSCVCVHACVPDV